ncbi:MAG TPA: antibiotic biosynthesis monooxygenase [Candidatus Desulfaltia sp.]|nr:antibiotic biosynthesis monooxygenase [Candidatus Desulfaltia sp.]
MFARILRSRLKIDKIDEATRTFREGVIPLCREQRGFKGGYFLSDPKTGESVAITFWESREAMLANEQSHFFQEQVAKFIPFYTKPPVREAYEVILQEEAETPKD